MCVCVCVCVCIYTYIYIYFTRGYDKIVCDVPCTGDGTTRKHPEVIIDDDCSPTRDTSPHKVSTGTAPSGTPPPAQPPPPPQTRGTQSHSASTPLKRLMLTPEGGPEPRVSA